MTLTVTVKNIRVITVKIYRVDLEKRLLSGEADIDEQMNLKYITPSSSLQVEVSSSDPLEEVKERIILEELSAQQGVFIIELEG